MNIIQISWRQGAAHASPFLTRRMQDLGRGEASGGAIRGKSFDCRSPSAREAPRKRENAFQAPSKTQRPSRPQAGRARRRLTPFHCKPVRLMVLTDALSKGWPLNLTRIQRRFFSQCSCSRRSVGVARSAPTISAPKSRPSGRTITAKGRPNPPDFPVGHKSPPPLKSLRP